MFLRVPMCFPAAYWNTVSVMMRGHMYQSLDEVLTVFSTQESFLPHNVLPGEAMWVEDKRRELLSQLQTLTLNSVGSPVYAGSSVAPGQSFAEATTRLTALVQASEVRCVNLDKELLMLRRSLLDANVQDREQLEYDTEMLELKKAGLVRNTAALKEQLVAAEAVLVRAALSTFDSVENAPLVVQGVLGQLTRLNELQESMLNTTTV